jgi:hypothetical protein
MSINLTRNQALDWFVLHYSKCRACQLLRLSSATLTSRISRVLWISIWQSDSPVAFITCWILYAVFWEVMCPLWPHIWKADKMAGASEPLFVAGTMQTRLWCELGIWLVFAEATRRVKRRKSSNMNGRQKPRVRLYCRFTVSRIWFVVSWFAPSHSLYLILSSLATSHLLASSASDWSEICRTRKLVLFFGCLGIRLQRGLLVCSSAIFPQTALPSVTLLYVRPQAWKGIVGPAYASNAGIGGFR